MPIDTELLAALQLAAASQPASTDLPAMRAHFAVNGASLPRPEVGALDELRVQTRGGIEVPVRLYRPKSERVSGPAPLLIFLHGGGWIFGDLDTHDAACRHLVEQGGCAVAAVGYRLAPEHPFPAGLDDCQAAAEWLLDSAAALGLDAARIAIGGESAGGNLAAVLARKLARRDGARPMLQLLLYPLVDCRFIEHSITEVVLPGLTLDELKLMRSAYLRDEADILNPDASPVLAGDLAGLPPAYVMTVEIDPLRDEGETYALKLARAGVLTTLERVPGLVHGFMFASADIGIIGRSYSRIGQWLRRGFASPDASSQTSASSL